MSASEFDQFWAAYPRKVAKGDARKAWEKAVRQTPDLLAACLSTLAWQRECRQWTRDEGQFVPYPATWLNGERWSDENPEAERNAARVQMLADRAAEEAERRERQARVAAELEARQQVWGDAVRRRREGVA